MTVHLRTKVFDSEQVKFMHHAILNGNIGFCNLNGIEEEILFTNPSRGFSGKKIVTKSPTKFEFEY